MALSTSTHCSRRPESGAPSNVLYRELWHAWAGLLITVPLKGGVQMQVDLGGGYYYAGNYVKFGFPTAFTTTMLSWSVIEFAWLMKGKDLGARIWK
ncbi:hypothetical protein HHK36_019224 [Tetracentron sinense]|uniref:cellulase n=1 Tax=Tetracentron sinense TaxID=13715 RepID=A0A835D9V3_TETSI|nr:hypothetical protein HHK36_019224 [Tetracentron sinense]